MKIENSIYINTYDIFKKFENNSFKNPKNIIYIIQI